MRSTQRRVLGAARVQAVVGHERPIRGRLERDVEDVDEGDPALGRPAAPSTALFATMRVVLLARVAVVRAGRRDRVVRDRDRDDPVGRQPEPSSASRIRHDVAS